MRPQKHHKIGERMSLPDISYHHPMRLPSNFPSRWPQKHSQTQRLHKVIDPLTLSFHSFDVKDLIHPAPETSRDSETTRVHWTSHRITPCIRGRAADT